MGEFSGNPPPDSDTNFQETSFYNPLFEDDNTEYNINYTTNLSENETFDTTPTPNLSERRNFAIDLKTNRIRKALIGTEWGGRETELNLYFLSVNARFVGDDIYVNYFGKEYKITSEKTKGKILAYNTMKIYYGKSFADFFKGFFTTQETPYQPSKFQSTTTQTEETRFIEEVINNPQPINKLIDTNEETLKSQGFTENALREWRGLIKTGTDLAAVKKQKDMEIKELEKKLEYLERDFIKSVEEDVQEKERLKKELVEEQGKARYFEKLLSENKTSLKNLVVDLYKNKENVPLKVRLKLLFKLKGFTIAAIITAITMMFTTIGLSINNIFRGKSPSPDPKTPDDPKTTEGKVKKGLKKFAKWLLDKSKAAAPGIIGSIISFILKSAAAVVGFIAEHLIIVLIILVSSIIYGLIESVKYLKNSRK